MEEKTIKGVVIHDSHGNVVDEAPIYPQGTEELVTQHNADQDAHPLIQDAITGIRTQVERRLVGAKVRFNDGHTEDVELGFNDQGEVILLLPKETFGKIDGVSVNGEELGVDENGKVDINFSATVDGTYSDTPTVTPTIGEGGIQLDFQGLRGVGIADMVQEQVSTESGGVNVARIYFENGVSKELIILNGKEGKKGDTCAYDPEDPSIPAFQLATELGQSGTKSVTQKLLTDELEGVIKKTVSGVAVSYPAASASSGVQKSVTINAATGVIGTTASTNDIVYFNSVKFAKGDIIEIVGSNSTARILQFGFTTTDPSSLQTLVGLTLTDVVETGQVTSFTLKLIVPYDNAYLLYHRYSSYTVTFTRYSLSTVKSLPTTIAANKTDIEAKLANEMKDVVTKSTNASSFSYSENEIAQINTSTSKVDAGATSSRKVYYSSRTFQKGDQIHIVTSSVVNMILVVGFTTTNPVERMATEETLVGMQLTNVTSYGESTAHDHWFTVPYDDAYMLYYRYTNTATFTWTVNSLASIKAIETKMADDKLKVTPQGFTFNGYGNTSVNKKFYTIPGHRYRIRRNKYTWNTEGIADSTEVIALYKTVGGLQSVYYKRSKAQQVSATLPNPFDFTAESVDYYTLYFKATSGESVTFDIQDVTEIVPYDERGTTDIVQMCGGTMAVKNRLFNISKAGGLRLLYFSDAHNGTYAVEQIMNFADKAGYIHDVLSGGDNVNNLPNDAYVFANAKSVLTVVGNHDVYNGNDNKLPSKDVFDIHYGEHTTHWTGVTFPENYEEDGLCYWYKDYTIPKVRLIGIDCINWDTAEGTWLEGVLADAITNNLHVVICTHYKPANFTGVRTCTFNSLVTPLSQQYTPSAVNGIVASAISNGLKFVCYLCGHEHKPYFGYVSDHTDQWAFAADKPSPPIGVENCDRRNINGEEFGGNGNTYKVYYSFYILNIDTARGVIAISTVGNNRDMYERPMNNLVFDYINHQILSNT